MSLRRLQASLLALIGLACFAQSAHSQGMMIGRMHHVPIARSYEIRDVAIDARVRDQVAEVQVSQTFYNPGSTVIESEYLFPLPEEGAIQNFVLLVDGKEMPGRLMAKDEARRIYEEIVRTKRDPALLEYMGRGMFKTSVFPIPPGAERKVTLKYTQLCKRERDVVEFTYPLSTQRFTAKPIQKLSLTMRIESKDAIKSLYSPIYDTVISRAGEHEAKVELTLRESIPTQDFKLVYTLSEGAIGATVLSYKPSDSEDGYFLLLASPQVKAPDQKPLPKSVVFVIDRSGSMAGKKIEQAKNALSFVLNNLREDDMFNIVAYDDRVETYKPELQRYNSASREEAARFVSNIREGGSTNINEALTTAMSMLTTEARPSYVIFLTDGLPTAGETAELKITANAKNSNKAHVRLFAFGVGFDVNARLLDRLSGGNSGTSEYVRPDEDLEKHVGAFYSKMTRPVLANLAINLGSTDINRTYPRDIPDLFEGGQIVWSGRYRTAGRTTVKLAGKVGSESRSIEFPVELAGSGRGNSFDFVERLWAIRRVGYIIDQIDLNGQNKELTDELVALSTKYGILTPYTSFLADDRVDLKAQVSNRRFATERLSELNVVQGGSGVAQRGVKQGYLNADKADLARSNAFVSESLAAAAPSAPAPGGTVMLGRAGGGGPVSGSGPSGPVGFRAGGMMATKPAQQGQSQTQNVRQLGNKAFFFKSNRWVDTQVTAEGEAKAVSLEQFSEAFFKLAREQSPEVNQYLSMTEPVTVNLNGHVYKIDPPKATNQP